MRDDGIYEKPMVDRFVEDAKNSRVFFDIGGNIGNYSIIYKKVSYGVCYCWEPEYRYIFLHWLNQLVNFKNWRNVYIYRKFVSNHDDNNTVCLNNFSKINNVYPDLMKIDVEGAEAEILPSLDKGFFKKNLKIYLEFHPVDIERNFELDPYEFIEFIWENFSTIELNVNHWGEFKKIPPGVWRETTKNELIKITKEIMSGNRSPRGYGLLLADRII